MLVVLWIALQSFGPVGVDRFPQGLNIYLLFSSVIVNFL